ncbi:hypothetical protein GGF32_004041 [Allomyces javanicus]|nr:hypothetical protein GGF32_004041 [Allomyces javanicus]
MARYIRQIAGLREDDSSDLSPSSVSFIQDQFRAASLPHGALIEVLDVASMQIVARTALLPTVAYEIYPSMANPAWWGRAEPKSNVM